eukprot:scaffold88994_cov50-Phaeocystis_antarctica.AAC.4
MGTRARVRDLSAGRGFRGEIKRGRGREGEASRTFDLVHGEVIVVAPRGRTAVVVGVVEVLVLHVEDDHVERHRVAKGDLARLSQRVAAVHVRCRHVACGALVVGRADAVTMNHARPTGQEHRRGESSLLVPCLGL